MHRTHAAFLVMALAQGCAASQPGAAEAPHGPNPNKPAQPAATAEAGVDLPNGKTPLPGLYTGGQPSEAQLQQAARQGVTTVISLREPGEPGSEGERDTVEGLGMTYVSIPVAGAQGLTEEAAQALGQALSATEGAPTILHCGSGNRAGALLALKAHHVDGTSPAEALELGRRAGLTTLEDAVQDKLGRTAR